MVANMEKSESNGLHKLQLRVVTVDKINFFQFQYRAVKFKAVSKCIIWKKIFQKNIKNCNKMVEETTYSL